MTFGSLETELAGIRSAFGAGYGNHIDADVLQALDRFQDRAEHHAGMARLKLGLPYDYQDYIDLVDADAVVARAKLDTLSTRKLARR